jgi:hypothetical protein
MEWDTTNTKIFIHVFNVLFIINYLLQENFLVSTLNFASVNLDSYQVWTQQEI